MARPLTCFRELIAAPGPVLQPRSCELDDLTTAFISGAPGVSAPLLVPCSSLLKVRKLNLLFICITWRQRCFRNPPLFYEHFEPRHQPQAQRQRLKPLPS